MKEKEKLNLRVLVDVDDHKVRRVSVKERSRDGTYEPLERPWGIKVLAALKLAAKAVTLASHGVADLEEVCRTASAPRRRKVGKKPPTDEGGVRTNRTGLGRNGPDRQVSRST
jgi:hypothetical protein